MNINFNRTGRFSGENYKKFSELVESGIKADKVREIAREEKEEKEREEDILKGQQKIEEFKAELKKLEHKYGLYIYGCDCCVPPWIETEKGNVVGNLERKM